MLIANPIYDVVFHHLMEDLTIAKYLIGHIIEKKIIHLEPNPTVTSFKVDQGMHVYRLDYAATIKTKKEGTYKVIIEIQKALIIEDILRFRRYLAKQYSSYIEEKVHDKRTSKTQKYHKEEKKVTLPIISIYFLGSQLEHLTQPVVKVKRHYYDAATNQEIKKKEDFIEKLTHDSYIIQIPYLPEKKRTELERILAIFDQHYIVNTNNPHRLNLPDKAANDILRRLVRRLEQAQASEKLENIMRIEDEYYEYEELIKQQKQTIIKANKIIKLTNQKVEKEKQKLEKEKQRAEKEKAKKERLKEILQNAGIDYET